MKWTRISAGHCYKADNFKAVKHTWNNTWKLYHKDTYISSFRTLKQAKERAEAIEPLKEFI